MNETLLTVDQAVLLAAILGLVSGAIIALVSAKSLIKNFKIKEAYKWETLINSAMSNAYKAGYVDGKAKKKDLAV